MRLGGDWMGASKSLLSVDSNARRVASGDVLLFLLLDSVVGLLG